MSNWSLDDVGVGGLQILLRSPFGETHYPLRRRRAAVDPGDYFLTIGIGQMGQLAWDAAPDNAGLSYEFSERRVDGVAGPPRHRAFRTNANGVLERLEQSPRTMEGGRQRAQV